MRQTLLRIRLDDLWSTEPVAGVFAIGAGYLLIPWALFGLWWLFQAIRETGLRIEHWPSVLVWCVCGGMILTLPQFAAVNSIPVFGYGFMLFAGFLAAGWVGTRRAQREGLSTDLIWDVGMWIFFSGILGARLFYVIQYSDRVFGGKQGLELLWAAVNLPDGGLVLYGGVLLASLAYFVFCRLRRISPLVLADILVPSVFIGVAFGRMGCFLNGCCYGDRCELPWAVTFPQGSVPFQALVARGFLLPDAAASLPLHPTQIYSSINALVLAVLTSVYFKYRSRDGAVVAVALITYPISRIVIEILRGDEMGQFGTGLTISQWVSIGVLIFGIGLACWCWLMPSARQQPVVADRVKSTA